MATDLSRDWPPLDHHNVRIRNRRCSSWIYPTDNQCPWALCGRSEYPASLAVRLSAYSGVQVAIIKNMKDYDCVFSDIQTSFTASVLIYQNSCYQLLGPLNLPDQQMNDLLVQRSTEAWKAPALQNDLEKRLGPNYRIYPSLISKLNKRILLFCEKLKLNHDLKARFYTRQWKEKKKLIIPSLHGSARMESLTKKRAKNFSGSGGSEYKAASTRANLPSSYKPSTTILPKSPN